ncbi:1363_t:CDS:2 [Cetraspora pellucida]|uniref:1363_t:CDS:1 n=1 Tax=Cetraspora pellucida TaxID=1433469 RepID=A0ACA9N069_9GLOM|nr:1363_t:CDS:2 [Cetraspora pellucida]
MFSDVVAGQDNPIEITSETTSETTSKLAGPSAKQENILNWCKPISSAQSNKLHSKLLNAIIYGNISFNFIDNLYFRDFLQELAPSYQLLSLDMLCRHVLTRMFSNHLQKKLTTMSIFTDATICLDGWTDISRNSIYGFMILKEHEKHVIDIIDLSANHHKASFIMNKIEEVLVSNGIQISSAITCDTNNPPALQTWQKENSISHFLSTFCKTKWYLIAKVCLGVFVFERGFQHCLRLSKSDKINYPEIRENIKHIINDKYHFASNDILINVIKPVVNAIGRLKSRDATLAEVFKELIYIHHEIFRLEVPISGFKAYALVVISQRAREFSDDIYFITLFLFSAYKKIAMLRHIDGNSLVHGCLELARVWNFKKPEASLLFKELNSYKDGISLFNHISSNLQQSPRSFWANFTRNSPILHQFAMKVFAIAPHRAACE